MEIHRKQITLPGLTRPDVTLYSIPINLSVLRWRVGTLYRFTRPLEHRCRQSHLSTPIIFDFKIRGSSGYVLGSKQVPKIFPQSRSAHPNHISLLVFFWAKQQSWVFPKFLTWPVHSNVPPTWENIPEWLGSCLSPSLTLRIANQKSQIRDPTVPMTNEASTKKQPIASSSKKGFTPITLFEKFFDPNRSCRQQCTHFP